MTIEKVIDNGFCIGCGTCKVVNPEAVDIHFQDGIYEAEIYNRERLKSLASKVCPFSDDSKNENELKLKDPRLKDSKYIGPYSKILTGGVSSDSSRENASSGGMTSWVLGALFNSKLVDSIIHVRESGHGHFEFSIADSNEEILNNKKSKYYPVTLSEVLLKLDSAKTYAITGVPCFIKSISLLQDQGYFNNIKYKLALFCGHFKTSHFSEMLSWELGVNPKEIQSIDFRKKIKGHAASDYFVEVESLNNRQHRGRISEMFGTNWAHGLFKPSACDFCDDICGELADVTFGDAWLPEYTNNWLGTNIVISRNLTIDSIIESGINSGELLLGEVAEADVIRSQAANYRHRRGGIIARKKQLSLKWLPKKRLDLCTEFYDENRDETFALRWELASESRRLFSLAKSKNNFYYFKIPMFFKLLNYDIKEKGLVNTLKSILRKRIAKVIRVLGLRKRTS